LLPAAVGRDNLLQVIEHQQRWAGAQGIVDLVERGAVAAIAQTERARDRRAQQRRIGYGCKRNKHHLINKYRAQVLSRR
jgi:hypothetical protein